MEIVTGIHQVDGVNANCYILVRDGLTVIDTGLPAGSGKKIISYIQNTLYREPSEIKTIVITHFHMDHIGGVATLKNAAPGAKVAIGKEDAGYVSGQIPQPVYPGIRGLLLRFAGAIMHPGLFSIDIRLNDGDRVDGLQCIHIPGHTPGSIGLYDERTKTLFAGDILRYNGTALAEGPAPFTLDLNGSRQSIRKIAALDFDLLLPGHGVPLQDGASAKVREFAASLPTDG
ncbi:MAG: MBL fold metallo-hydrolase [Methanomicrobiales archaeon HGW-Methanomicrobiales-1]|jgi:glyoxylase-like metal-dependent hydrolase (beta-lactamase superfamily II)|nr:MAG: MBL fold metallo-hydrolase [Methanomicrobiales archaeon HGW-Methanomicrobiales-1]